MDPRSIHTKTMVNNAAVSKLRPEKGHSVRHGPTTLQGRRPRRQSRQRGLGLVLCRHKAL